jgi:hypothetical protein
MVRIVIASLLVAYVPGALTYRVPGAGRDLRAGLPAEERVFWAVVLSVCWSLAVVLGLAAVDAYTLTRLLLVNTGLSALLLLGFRSRLLYAGRAALPGPSALGPVALFAAGLFLFFPASEYVIGGKDPGTYVNEGIQIAQTRSLLPVDPLVASVPAASRDLFFPWHKSRYYYGLRFMGFFVQDPAAGKVVGQFPHLFPASIAVAYDLAGLTGARSVVGWWAILGLVAVYLVAARLFGPIAAAAACALLAVNVIQVWFSRYPNSESVMQALVFAALLAFGRATEGSRWFFGPVAGGLLGFMLFLRYDVVLAMAAFAAAAAVLPPSRRVGAGFVIALVATALVGLWYLANPMIAYAAYPLLFTRARGGWLLVAAGLAAIAVFRWLVRRAHIARAVERGLPAVLAMVVLTLSIYAYFFRVESGRLALHDAIAFQTFAWYITPWALGGAVAGLAALLSVRFWRDPAFFVTLTTFGLFFFYKTRIVPEHFWASRRFLAVILPGALIVLAGCARIAIDRAVGGTDHGGGSTWRRRLAGVLVVGVLTPLGVAFWHASAPVRGHVEYEGLIPPLEKLANSIAPRDLVIVESRDAGSDLHVLALPLAYIYSKHVLVLDSAAPSKRSLENFVSWAEGQYDRVLFLGGGGTDLLSRHLRATFLHGDRFQVKEYDARVNDYPQGVRRKDLEFGVYRLTRTDPAPRGPVGLAIGRDDDLNVVRFHAREVDGGQPYRWSGPQSFVMLLGIPAEAREISVWMGTGGRPPQAAPADVEIAIDEDVLGTVRVEQPLAKYTVPLPAAVAARAAASDDPARLRLRVTPWVPSELVGGSDTRSLGVMVTRVEVR